MDWKEFATNVNTELWGHVKRPSSRYVLQPASTRNRLSEWRQKEQSEVWLRFLLARFLRVANELFKYRTMKLKMLRDILLWTSAHMEFSIFRELSIRKDKIAPCEVSSCRRRLVCSVRAALRTSLVLLYKSYWMLDPSHVVFQSNWMFSFGDDFRMLRWTAWHWRNLIEGSWRLNPNWFLGRIIPLNVALIGSSSHSRI